MQHGKLIRVKPDGMWRGDFKCIDCGHQGTIRELVRLPCTVPCPTPGEVERDG